MNALAMPSRASPTATLPGAPPGRLDECRRLDQIDTGDGGDKIDQQFAKTDGSGHAGTPFTRQDG
jgi:hypothetical protein